ncbi:SPOSA6832_03822 [Sporobolomyces salmonicolor]|uniref:Eukaryotic translation initiation factor 3 subunit I n=1 Tax=Sporidiobolus salmonicolor TaxID=5005 RepID=A0A0D6ER37_SPOSA|nr:SPOSA6832_03822 [Sporobolomyces salmonicolor]
MRPIMLSGHERSLTQIKYNAEGDLLFSCSKDHVINAWHSHNGERLGTYDGHNGTVWTVDVDSTSTYLVSGSADNAMKLWNVRTGQCLYTWEFPTAVKRVAWSEDDSRVLAVTEKRMGYPGGVSVFAINRDEPSSPKADGEGVAIRAESKEPQFVVKPSGSKATVAAWCGLDEFIVTAHEDGTLNLWDTVRWTPSLLSGHAAKLTDNLRMQEEGYIFFDKEEKAHSGVITDLQMSPDGTYFITSSKDKSAKIWSIGPDKNAHGEEEYLTHIKTYTSEPPLNSAAIIPGKPYVRPLLPFVPLCLRSLTERETEQILMGGGQEAMNVTTTGARHGHFEVRFFHRIFEEEVARVKGGFGPCNTYVKWFLSFSANVFLTRSRCRIAAHPQGKGYAIGGEDGCELDISLVRCEETPLIPIRLLADVRVHHFDEDWFTMARLFLSLSLRRSVRVANALVADEQKPYGALEPED